MQNTVTNLGASIGTALAGAVLIAVLTTTFLGGVSNNPAVPAEMAAGAGGAVGRHPVRERRRPRGDAGKGRGAPSHAQAIVDDNASARINGLRAALAVLAFLALLGLGLTRPAAHRRRRGDDEAEVEETGSRAGAGAVGEASSAAG